MDRRQFVAASGLVAITGCLARGNENDGGGDEGPANEDSLPEPLQTVLDPVPSEAEDSKLRYLYVVKPDPDETSEQPTSGYGGQQLGLDAASVDRAATGIYGQYSGTVTAVAGEFSADDLEVPGRAATTVDDGFAVAASGGSGSWEAGIDAAEAADDPDVGVNGDVPVETLFGPLTDAAFTTALLTLDEETVPDDASIDPDIVGAVAMGRNSDVEAREETVTYVALFVDGETPDEAVIEELLAADSDEETTPEDVEIETDDRRATTTFTRKLPQSRLPDNSPDVYVGIASRSEGDSVTLQFSGEESVDAANLEYRVDGEQAEPPWAEDATIEPEDRYEIDVPPMTHVAVLWVDPELEDVEQPLGHSVVDSHDAFAGTYDHDADEIVVEYTLDRTVEADRFDVVRRAEGSGEEATTPLTEYVDALEAGTEIVLTDVDYGQWITIEMNVEDGSDLSTETVFWYSADPPGQFTHDHENGGHVLVYLDDAEAAAENFRVSIDGEPAETQWSDVAESLTDGDRLELDVEVGDAVTVEYVGDDEPVEVYARTVLPDAEFAFDVGESQVEITHDGGDAIDADALSVDVFPSTNDTRSDAFAAEYDTVEEGDSVTVEYEPQDDSEATPYVTVQFDGQTLDHFVQSMRGDGDSGSDDGSGTDDAGSAGDSGGDESAGAGGESTSTQAADD